MYRLYEGRRHIRKSTYKTLTTLLRPCIGRRQTIWLPPYFGLCTTIMAPVIRRSLPGSAMHQSTSDHMAPAILPGNVTCRALGTKSPSARCRALVRSPCTVTEHSVTGSKHRVPVTEYQKLKVCSKNAKGKNAINTNARGKYARRKKCRM
ncbi:hypothetical protein DPMN_017431 [Dreissena polymorpha]|uniref:Uncharacterized protein n=1 Tax=Dreissena polymorpha TaxID=45954 RepID=A0A9D4ND70_DREPO|nr:hypothetical protein DPMN_017431 [Dreissena polymorpha]